MATIRYTHGYELLYRLALMVASLILLVVGFELLGPIGKFAERILPTWLSVILMIAAFIFGLAGAATLLSKTVLPEWLPSFLYVRLSIFTKINPSEAERLSFLFNGSIGGIWYPLSSLRKIDPEFRREALFRFANKIAAEHGWQKPFAMPEDSLAGQRQQSQHQENGSRQSTGSTRKQQAPQDSQVFVCLQILGLNEMPKSFGAVKLAYRRKIREFHPDKFAGERAEVLQYAEETSKRLNVAYAYLDRHFAEKAR